MGLRYTEPMSSPNGASLHLRSIGAMLELRSRDLGGLRADFARKADTGEVLNPLVF